MHGNVWRTFYIHASKKKHLYVFIMDHWFYGNIMYLLYKQETHTHTQTPNRVRDRANAHPFAAACGANNGRQPFVFLQHRAFGAGPRRIEPRVYSFSSWCCLLWWLAVRNEANTHEHPKDQHQNVHIMLCMGSTKEQLCTIMWTSSSLQQYAFRDTHVKSIWEYLIRFGYIWMFYM